MHGSPSHERADHEAAASAASAGRPASCSARTSSTIRPWTIPPPASVPANTGTPASYAARTTAPDEACSRRIGAEGVRCDPRTLLVRGGDRGRDRVGRPLGSQVPDAAVDPVADQLDPPVAAAGLHPHLVRELL